MIVGCDIGGTHTDFVVFDPASGRLLHEKVRTDTRAPERGVVEGLGLLAARGVAPGAVDYFLHGTTRATNALLELKGARTGLLVTAGFRGIYEVAEQTRQEMFTLDYHRPDPLVSAYLTEEVEERIDRTGVVLTPLDEEQALAAIRRLRERGVISIAISLLFSFLNPAHELRLRELVHRVDPECHVSISSEVLPQIREYYRLSATVVDAYVAPVLGDYLGRLREAVQGSGVQTRRLYLMLSNGGVTDFGAASGGRAVQTLLSGPAAGVVAGSALARRAGEAKVLTLDIGGTSTDICVLPGSEIPLSRSGTVVGRQVRVPMIDVHTIGAGGGTVAWVDGAGLLKVGPRSAGADPGPGCYGLGGEDPTVTDAALALGYLNPDYFLGGKLRLNPDLARRTLESLLRPLGLNLEDAARGVVRVLLSVMEKEVRGVFAQLGEDPRDYSLIAFGGGGPLYATSLAREMKIPRVVVPLSPGTFSALGLIVSNVRHDYVRTRLSRLDATGPEEVTRIFAGMEEQALTEFSSVGIDPGRISFARVLDLRYSGQGYELGLPFDPRWKDFAAEARWAFDEAHLRKFGHKADRLGVEIVNYHLVATAATPAFVPQPWKPSGGEPRKGERKAYFSDWVTTPVWDRYALPVGFELEGPAIVEEMDSTTVILEGQRAVVAPHGELRIDVPFAS